MRLRRQIAAAPSVPNGKRADLLDAIYDDAFLDELGAQAVELYGEPRDLARGLRDWLAKIDWLRVIQIALTLLLLFLGSDDSDTPRQD